MGISEQAEGGIVLFRGIYTPLVAEAERDPEAQTYAEQDCCN